MTDPLVVRGIFANLKSYVWIEVSIATFPCSSSLARTAIGASSVVPSIPTTRAPIGSASVIRSEMSRRWKMCDLDVWRYSEVLTWDDKRHVIKTRGKLVDPAVSQALADVLGRKRASELGGRHLRSTSYTAVNADESRPNQTFWCIGRTMPTTVARTNFHTGVAIYVGYTGGRRRMDPVINPYSPGSGRLPVALVGRAGQLNTWEIALKRVTTRPDPRRPAQPSQKAC